MKSVFAIVVTFNRPDALRQCLDSLWAQRKDGLKRIHVVVNSNDIPTTEIVKFFAMRSDCLTYSCYENVGPAGGFHYGLESFLNEDCEYAWLMDDDVTIEPGCLAELLQSSGDHDYIFPKVIKGDGQEIVSFGWWAVLIRRELIVKAGLPITDLFFWAEDTEYLQNRLGHVHGIQPYRCQSAVANHLHQRKKKKASWYYYYTVRNTLYYRRYIVGYTWRRVKRTLFLIFQSLFTILLKEDHKMRKLKLLVYGLYHGIQGKIGKLVDPAKNK